MKKKWWFLCIVPLTLSGVPSCDKPDYPSSSANSTGTISMDLSDTVSGGEHVCVKGDIVVTDVNTGQTFTLPNASCRTTALTQVLVPSQYTATIPNPTCTVSNLPKGLTYTGCDVIPTDPFDVTVAQTTKVSIHVTFHFAEAADVTVVVGVGAGDFTIDADAGVSDYCGGIRKGDICQDGVSYCLDYDNTGHPKCYVLCEDARDCESGQTCHLVARPADNAGNGGEGGVFTIHRGQHISSLDDVPGVCIDTGSGGAGGTTGSGGTSSGAGGTSTGSGGSSNNGTGGSNCSCSGGSGGAMPPPSLGPIMVTFRWVLPTAVYLAGDVKIGGFAPWTTFCKQENDEDPNPNVYQCTVGLPPGPLDFDLAMADPQSPTQMIWYGEENFEQCGYDYGGDGQPQGDVAVMIGSDELETTLKHNPTFCDPDPNTHCETDPSCVGPDNPKGMEMLTYNRHVDIPNTP